MNSLSSRYVVNVVQRFLVAIFQPSPSSQNLVCKTYARITDKNKLFLRENIVECSSLFLSLAENVE